MGKQQVILSIAILLTVALCDLPDFVSSMLKMIRLTSKMNLMIFLTPLHGNHQNLNIFQNRQKIPIQKKLNHLTRNRFKKYYIESNLERLSKKVTAILLTNYLLPSYSHTYARAPDERVQIDDELDELFSA